MYLIRRDWTQSSFTMGVKKFGVTKMMSMPIKSILFFIEGELRPPLTPPNCQTISPLFYALPSLPSKAIFSFVHSVTSLLIYSRACSCRCSIPSLYAHFWSFYWVIPSSSKHVQWPLSSLTHTLLPLWCHSATSFQQDVLQSPLHFPPFSLGIYLVFNYSLRLILFCLELDV